MSAEKDIEDEIIEVAKLRTALLASQQAMDAEVEKAIPPDVKNKIENIRARYLSSISSLQVETARRESALLQAVLKHGKTVKTAAGTAMFQRPKLTWDGAALLNYAATKDYAILKFRKIGKAAARLIWPK